ncbi:hypothetical protein [Pelomonas cellulosilytica]|uniref:Type II secretion system protein GspC N-terminal domain-containing protein n=1 Tax=Pelomonas cellulosilytica TaxID=2906762 RepID=A0ABS8XR18_9BURK|nr:hypothetical protein [Pelomonas sp. P8]MCE4554273.1 hypothetical protein [Pelomonas sp. P8]
MTLFDPAPWSSAPAVQAPTQTAAAQQVATVEVPAGPPPLPFRPLGRFDDNQGPVVFLIHGDQNLVVRKGERFADGYRLEEINGTVVSIRHLATGQLQTLDLGSGS